MAGIKISELPEASCVVGDELVAIVQDSCTKFVAASAIGATGDSTITSVIAGCGLQGGGSFGAVTLHLDANCFAKYEGTTTVVRSTSACWDGAYTTVQANSASWTGGGGGGSGTVTCVDSGDGLTGGPVTTSGTLAVDSTVVRTTGDQCLGGNKDFSGNILSAGTDLNDLFGSGGGGGISTAGAGLSTDGTNVGIDSGTLTPFDQSGCAGLDCTGVVSTIGGGDGIDVTGTAATKSVAVDSTVIRTTGNQDLADCKNFTGNILSAGTDLLSIFSTGGGGVDTGTACRVTRYNSAGNNVEDSNLLDSSSLLTIDVDTVVNGSLSAIQNVVFGTSNDLSTTTGTFSGGSNFIVGGDTNSVAEDSTETSHTGIVGGTRNIINGGCNNVIIGGELNCLCCNTSDASFTGNSIVGSMSSCIAGECSGVFNSNGVTVTGDCSVVIGGCGHTTNCDKSYVFGGINHTINGNDSAILGGCCNQAGSFLNTITVAVGGMCNCSEGDYAAAVGGFRNSVGSDTGAIIGGCNNTLNDGADQSVIAGGSNNLISSSDCFSFIGGGATNRVCQDYSAIVGGGNNTTTECYSFMGGGALNNVLGAGAQGAVIGGCSNNVCHNSSVIAGGTAMTSVSGCMLHTEKLYVKNLPTTDPGVPGVVWNDAGTLKISI